MSHIKLKILFINFQSGMHITQGYMQYVTSGWKYVLPHNSKGLQDVITFIQRENPDIVSFAEIDGPSWRSKGLDHVKEICTATELRYHAYFPTRKTGTWVNQGSAILSRYPLSDSTQMKLPGYDESRYLCSASIDVEGEKITYKTTHLSTNEKLNSAQRFFIAKKLQKIDGPAILTGDFNIEKYKLGLIVSHTDFNDLDFDKTFPSWHPRHTLDHMFISSHGQAENITTYTDEHFSDHLPIGATITF